MQSHKYVQDYADCSLEVSCGTYASIDFGTSGLTGTLTSESITIPTTYNSELGESTGIEIKSIKQKLYKGEAIILSDCCTINTDDKLQIKSSCFLDRLQPSLDGDYMKQDLVLNGRSTWKLSGSEWYLWYSSTAMVSVLLKVVLELVCLSKMVLFRVG